MNHPFDLDPAELEAIDLDFGDTGIDELIAPWGSEIIVTTLAIGEEGGSGPIQCISAPCPGSEGGGEVGFPHPPVFEPPMTTMALGEEGGGPPMTTMALGEEGGDPPTELEAMDFDFKETGIDELIAPWEGGIIATTLAIGEEGGGCPIQCISAPCPGSEGGGEVGFPPSLIFNPPMTTMALGEEGGDPPMTTMALGEEGGDPPMTTDAIGEEGGGPIYW
jgi:hypothetical protein